MGGRSQRMSTLLVTVRRIDAVKPHPNADRLDLAVVGGWQCVVPKNQYKGGELVTYIPPDSVLPPSLSEEIGVTKYLSKGRVRAATLRGESSFGIVMEPRGAEGDNVADLLGITKYEPPIKFRGGDIEPNHPLFHSYTEIENMRNYPAMFCEGERVIATEKIHGSCGRVGLVKGDDGEWTRLAGSKSSQRKFEDFSTYWFPWAIPSVAAMVDRLHTTARERVIVFGELFGKVQALRYGHEGRLGFRVFDIAVDGKYLDHEAVASICRDAGVEMAPVIYDGPYTLAAIAKAASGMSTIHGANHIREGVVVRPAIERTEPAIGRLILKYVSDEYLCGDWDGANE